MRITTLARIAFLAVLALFLLSIAHAQSAGQAQTQAPAQAQAQAAAQAQTQAAAPTSSAGPVWEIKCPGVPNVPMTADPEQSLPLQVVATLKCGEAITPLSNYESYAVNVKNAEGKTGYVASMFLKKIPAPKRPRPNSASLAHGVARWQEGEPGCDQFMSNGTLVESLTVNGVTAQVSLNDSGWKLRANVAIANGGAEAIHLEPSKFILDEIGSNGRPLFYQDPEQLAKNLTHQALWTETTAAPSRFSSSQSSTPTEQTNARFKTSVAPSASAPNYLIQQQYAEEDAVRNKGKQVLVNTAQQIRALALKPGTVEPNDKVSGSVWFERGKNPQQLVLRIPIGDQTFEFPLSFKQQK